MKFCTFYAGTKQIVCVSPFQNVTLHKTNERPIMTSRTQRVVYINNTFWKTNDSDQFYIGQIDVTF